MYKYIVISKHTGEDCVRALKEALAIGYLTHYEWGCKDGDHTGWAIIEAESKEQAMMSVPAFLREQARVVRLTKFDPAKVEAMHMK
jgi:ribulose bisphosphate carboxylase small subunit